MKTLTNEISALQCIGCHKNGRLRGSNKLSKNISQTVAHFRIEHFISEINHNIQSLLFSVKKLSICSLRIKIYCRRLFGNRSFWNFPSFALPVFAPASHILQNRFLVIFGGCSGKVLLHLE